MDQNENPASRWTTDPGAIPGEPDDYLDIPIGEDGEIGEAKAVIVEIETPGGSRWEARAFGGRFLGMFETRLGETRSEKCSTVDQTQELSLEAERTARIGRGQARVRRTSQARLRGVRTAEKTMTGVHQLGRNRQVYSVQGADALNESALRAETYRQ